MQEKRSKSSRQSSGSPHNGIKTLLQIRKQFCELLSVPSDLLEDRIIGKSHQSLQRLSVERDKEKIHLDLDPLVVKCFTTWVMHSGRVDDLIIDGHQLLEQSLTGRLVNRHEVGDRIIIGRHQSGTKIRLQFIKPRLIRGDPGPALGRSHANRGPDGATGSKLEPQR